MAGKGRQLSVLEAAGKLGVTPKTVRKWVKTGRLKGAVKVVRIVREDIVVDEASLARAFAVKCLWCGKEFESPHPEKARFCSLRHKDQYLWQERRKLLLRPKPKARPVGQKEE